MNLRDSRWFPFDVLAWQASPRVQAMEYAEQGFYLALLLLQWDKGSVPASIEGCAAALGRDAEMIRALWPRVAACFVKRGGSMINTRLHEERKIRERFLREQRKRGRLGGISKAKKRDPGYQTLSGGSHDAKPPLSQGMVWSGIEGSDQIRSDQKKDQPASRATFTQAENEARKRARVADRPSPSGNLPALVKLAHEILAAADPYTEPSELAERLKQRAADLRIDYGDHPDVRADAIGHALEIAKLQRTHTERDTRTPDHRSDFTPIGKVRS